MQISKVTSTKGNKNVRNGVSIEFNTYEVIHAGQLVKVKFDDKDYYFEVNEVSTTFDMLSVEDIFNVKANEIGYYNLFSKKKIDIRLLFNNMIVEIVTNEDEIKKINKESCYC